MALSLGFHRRNLTFVNFSSLFEKLFKDLKDHPIYNNDSNDGLNRVRSSVKELAFKTFYSYTPSDKSSAKLVQTLKTLSEDPSIVIIKPDKGNGIVLLDKSNYHVKMYDLLNDSDKFTLINDDWFKVIIKHEDQINRFLSSLLQNEVIDKATYDHLRIPSSRPGILYELLKIHKQGVPLRPILSSIGTCGYGLAKFLVPHLEHLTHNEYSVKDSFSFADEISKFDNANGLVMASFDIQSLFTNIPLDETINIII